MNLSFVVHYCGTTFGGRLWDTGGRATTAACWVQTLVLAGDVGVEYAPTHQSLSPAPAKPAAVSCALVLAAYLFVRIRSTTLNTG